MFYRIDASNNDGTLGRVVNHSSLRDNCEIQGIQVNGIIRAYLRASEVLLPDDEIYLNYGSSHANLERNARARSNITISIASSSSGGSPSSIFESSLSPQREKSSVTESQPSTSQITSHSIQLDLNASQNLSGPHGDSSHSSSTPPVLNQTVSGSQESGIDSQVPKRKLISAASNQQYNILQPNEARVEQDEGDVFYDAQQIENEEGDPLVEPIIQEQQEIQPIEEIPPQIAQAVAAGEQQHAVPPVVVQPPVAAQPPVVPQLPVVAQPPVVLQPPVVVQPQAAGPAAGVVAQPPVQQPRTLVRTRRGRFASKRHRNRILAARMNQDQNQNQQ